MALTEKEYKQLIDASLKLRLAESTLYVAWGALQKANEALREMLVKKTEEKC